MTKIKCYNHNCKSRDDDVLEKYKSMPDLIHNKNAPDEISNLKFVGIAVSIVIIIGFCMFFFGNEFALYLPLIPIIFGVSVFPFKKEYESLWRRLKI